MDFEKLFTEELVFFLDATSKEEVIQHMAWGLYKNGYVKKSYLEAVIEREKYFPTGLPMDEIGVAIPHTDCEHVNQPVIGVGILEKPVNFIEMGTTDKEGQIEIVFMLAIKEPESQVDVLQMITDLIQQPEILKKIKDCSLKANVVSTIKGFAQVG